VCSKPADDVSVFAFVRVYVYVSVLCV